MFIATNIVRAGTVFRGEFLGDEYIWRWDDAPRSHDVNGTLYERSLDGGLRYALEGGSYQAFRGAFAWQGATPNLADFTQAVQNAFAAWTVTDPVSGLHSTLSFTEDLNTTVSTVATTNFVNLGSEIDIFADDLGDPFRRGFTSVFAQGLDVRLTSGVTSYPSFAISGADIIINSNAGAMYTLDGFQSLITHELGHALGLADLEVADEEPVFIDDNYDDTNSSTALATLTNSWAALVNPLDPDDLNGTGLSLYEVDDDDFFNEDDPLPDDGDPGIDTPGVDILMESEGSIELIGVMNPLQNDDYGTRQFLYPVIAVTRGDMNGDGNVTLTDASLFIQALTNRAAYDAQAFPVDPDLNGDVNLDSTFDLGDTAAFSALLGGPASGRAVPEPSTLLFGLLAASGLVAIHAGRSPIYAHLV